jgi:hypothetical protein
MKSRLYTGQWAARWLVVLVIGSLIFSACSATSSASPTPTPTAPGVPPSISIEPPGPSINVAPRETTSLQAQFIPPEAQVTWSTTCYPDVNCNVLKNTIGADTFFTAPDLPGEQVIVRATVKDNYGREASTALAFKVQIPTPTPTPTPTPIPEPPVITSPKEEDEVEMNITVAGSVAKASVTAGTSLYVLVKPFRLDYWVNKSLPSITMAPGVCLLVWGFGAIKAMRSKSVRFSPARQ